MTSGLARTLHFMAIGSIVLATFWSAIFGYMVADRAIPVTQISNRILTPEVVSGQDLRLEHSVYRHRLCHTSVERTIFDSQGTRWALPDLDFYAIGPLGPDTYGQAIPVPFGASPGPARLRFALAWDCNFTQRFWPIVEVLPDLNFTILKHSAIYR